MIVGLLYEFVFHIFLSIRNMMFSVFGFEFIMIQIAVPGQCHGLFSKHV
jgi:hypothetical protein